MPHNLSRQVVIASGNPHKIEEIRSMLAGTSIGVISGPIAAPGLDPEEFGSSFAENARIKAEAFFKETRHAVLADDSGLCVEALAGAPGVHSKRFAGPEASDLANTRLLLERLADRKELAGRRAAFVCHLCYVSPGGEFYDFTGKLEGHILLAPSGDHGFGYDPVFQPIGYDCSLACLDASEKNKISHRGLALRKWRQFIEAEKH